MIFGHGSLVLSNRYIPKFFTIPENTYVITLVKSGVFFPINLVKYLYYFYRNNHHLFKDQDTSTELSEEGKKLFYYFNKIQHKLSFNKPYDDYRSDNLFFKNHLPGTIMNNQNIDIRVKELEKDSNEQIKKLGGINFLSEHIRENTRINNGKIPTLEELIQGQGPGVYIISSCRVIIGEATDVPELAERALIAARQISNQGFDLNENPLMPGRTIYTKTNFPDKKTHLFDYMPQENLNKIGFTQNNVLEQRIADYRNATTTPIAFSNESSPNNEDSNDFPALTKTKPKKHQLNLKDPKKGSTFYKRKKIHKPKTRKETRKEISKLVPRSEKKKSIKKKYKGLP